MSIRPLIRFAALILAVAASPAHARGQTYWSLFNIEGESAQTAQYVTYARLSDMLIDSNRLGTFSPNSFGFGRNIVGSGSNGDTYWSLFNIEGESAQTAQYVTYASLSDMLIDSNRLGTFSPNSFGFGHNIVGSGSDGDAYWSLFNIEGESAQTAQYVTYARLSDMLIDSNRLGTFSPNSFGFGRNIVGSGWDGRPTGGGGSGNGEKVPEPATLLLVGPALTALVLLQRRRLAQKGLLVTCGQES